MCVICFWPRLQQKMTPWVIRLHLLILPVQILMISFHSMMIPLLNPLPIQPVWNVFNIWRTKHTHLTVYTNIPLSKLRLSSIMQQYPHPHLLNVSFHMRGWYWWKNVAVWQTTILSNSCCWKQTDIWCLKCKPQHVRFCRKATKHFVVQQHFMCTFYLILVY